MSNNVIPYSDPNLDEEPKSLWTKFTERRLKVWQPILSPQRVIPCFIVCGIVFLIIGLVLLLTSKSVEEYFVDYTDKPTNSHDVGFFDVHIEKDMEPPIWMYYHLEGFFQNHRKYLKSRSADQLKAKSSPPKTSSQELDECEPWVTSIVNDQEFVNYPCGIIAQSIFNDSFALQIRDPQAMDFSNRIEVDSRAETIAWAVDVDSGKFVNLNPEEISKKDLQNQALLNMWILQRFPPVRCEQVVISDSKPFVPAKIATRNVTFQGSVERQVLITDCTDYIGTNGGPSCNFERDGLPFACNGDYQEVYDLDWGIENGHFIVWMRVAGLPSFDKLWGKIDRKIEAGSTVRVHYVSNFPVKPFHGRKAFVLSTATVLGGRNDALGIAYLAVGSACLIFGVVFLWHHVAYPRPLGDVSRLWVKPKYRDP
jgi:hypothetical protein